MRSIRCSVVRGRRYPAFCRFAAAAVEFELRLWAVGLFVDSSIVAIFRYSQGCLPCMVYDVPLDYEDHPVCLHQTSRGLQLFKKTFDTNEKLSFCRETARRRSLICTATTLHSLDD